jgi:hypothetical protein
MANATCNVGGMWEKKILGKDFRITVHSIKKLPKEDNYKADIEVRGPASLQGSENTQCISPARRYWVNRTSSPWFAQHSMLYSIDIHHQKVDVITLRVDHIDPHSNQVKIEFCVISGYPVVLE